MKKSKKLVALVERYAEVMQDLQIVEYEANNKFYFGEIFIMLKSIEAKGLEYEANLLKEEIEKENKELGNPPITDMLSFVKAVRNE